MTHSQLHTFHIPVMGTSFSIDTPIKVAKYGIDSVIQIMDDALCEKMREYYADKYFLDYQSIPSSEDDFRAKRITAYLNLLDQVIQLQLHQIKELPFEPGNELTKYFELLPDTSRLKKLYIEMLKTENPELKAVLQLTLKSQMKAGSVDVNIMTAVDRDNFDKTGNKLSDEYSDALSALRGFAKSTVNAGVVFSAGFNRRLYSYLEHFPEFFPGENQNFIKKVILKVSDYRSSIIQGKLLAKKGIWVSEYRIESGLNCGGHAFASQGYLLGPILEEFRANRTELTETLFKLCNEALAKKEKPLYKEPPPLRITVQGGIGTYAEDQLLLNHFEVDGTGWATPFLLVPEVTIVDEDTLNLLAKAGPSDVYLSNLSPLGVPFNSVYNTKSHQYRAERVEKGVFGSPCLKSHLCFNTEFSGKSLCTASTHYQTQKINQLKAQNLSEETFQNALQCVTQKACLCEDLGAGAYLKYNIPYKGRLTPIVCPGPNIAYFSKIATLAEMVSHIYGRLNLISGVHRPHMFINELKIYIDYLRAEIRKILPKPTEKQINYFEEFKNNLFEGIQYYKSIIPTIIEESKETVLSDLNALKIDLEQLTHEYTGTVFLKTVPI